MKAKILLVEDEPVLRRGIQLNLEEEGYLVDAFESAEVLLRERKDLMSESGPFDLAILDVMLPGRTQGIDLCRMLKSRWAFPVLFLTARSRLEQKLEAFDAGADDYVVKPFELEELLARVRARLKGRRAREGRIGRYRIDFSRDLAVHTSTGEEVRLTEKEIGILNLLLEHRGRPVSRDEILDAVWGESEFPTNRTIDNFIVRFRRIFEADPGEPRLFITRHGRGYELAPEPEEEK